MVERIISDMAGGLIILLEKMNPSKMQSILAIRFMKNKKEAPKNGALYY